MDKTGLPEVVSINPFKQAALTRDYRNVLASSSEEILPKFNLVAEAYERGEIDPDLWLRLLSITLNSLESMPDPVAKPLWVVTRTALYKLMDQPAWRTAVIRKLLDFVFAYSSEQVSDIKSQVIERLDSEIQLAHDQQSQEIVHLLSCERRIFEVPYTPRQVNVVTGTINRLRRRDHKASDRIQSNLAFRWLIQGLSLNVLSSARQSILTELKQEDFAKLDHTFSQIIYSQMQTLDADDLWNTLDVIDHWFRALDTQGESDWLEWANRIKPYNDNPQTTELDPDDLQTKIFVANSLVLEQTIQQLNRWKTNAKISEKLLTILRHLPCTRYYLNELLTLAKESLYEKHLPAICSLFREQVTGIGPNLPFVSSEGLQGDAGIQLLLRMRKMIDQTKYDQPAIQFLEEILYDIKRTPELRKIALSALVQIFPLNMGGICSNYLNGHTPADKIYPDVLKAIEDLKLLNTWETIRLAIVSNKSKDNPALAMLIRTAGILGDEGIIKVLLPLAFDHDDETIRKTATRALEDAGYDLSIRVETLRRELESEFRNLEKAHEDWNKLYEKSNDLEKQESDLQRKITLENANASKKQQDLNATVVDFRVASADIQIDLGKIDKQVKELMKRVNELQDRKWRLEMEITSLKSERDSLRSELSIVRYKITTETENQRRLSEELRQLSTRISTLQYQHEQKANDLRWQQQEMSRIRREEKYRVQQIQSTTNYLVQQSYTLESQIESLTYNLNTVYSQLESVKSDLHNAISEQNRIQWRYQMTTDEDSDEREYLRIESREIESEISSLRSQSYQLESNYNSLRSQQRSYQSQLNDVVGQYNQGVRDLDASAQRVASAEKKGDNIRYALNQITNDLNEVTYRQSTVQMQISTSQYVVSELKQQIPPLEKQIDRLEKEVRQLVVKLRDVINNLEAAERELAYWKAEKDRVEKKMKAQQTDYTRKINSQDGELRQTIDSKGEYARKENDTAKKLEDVYRQIHAVNDYINRLNNSLTNLKEEYDGAQKQNAAQQVASGKRHIDQSAKIYADHDQREQNRLLFIQRLKRGCDTYRRQHKELHQPQITFRAGKPLGQAERPLVKERKAEKN